MTALKSTSIMILGGPDAGKSNYIGALWMRLRRNKGAFRIPFEPDNIEYVERIVGHLREGNYPPRTEPDEDDCTFVAPIARAADPKTPIARITVPDMIGEVWKAASKDREIDPVWIQALRDSEAAMLFLRFGSVENVEMLDWVSSAELMQLQDAPANNAEQKPPTQLFVSDLLNILEEHLGRDTMVDRPRVAIMLAAWDGVGPPERAAGPKAFIRNDYPMLYGRMSDRSRLDLRTFGVSATGFNLKVPEERDAYLLKGPAEAGFAETEIGGKIMEGDLLMPLAWALEGEK